MFVCEECRRRFESAGMFVTHLEATHGISFNEAINIARKQNKKPKIDENLKLGSGCYGVHIYCYYCDLDLFDVSIDL